MRNLKPKNNERLMGLIFLFPLFSLFALKELLDIKNIHKILLFAILVFLSTQIISSIYTLNPTISIPLSLLRCSIIAGLIIYGFKYFSSLNYHFLGKIITVIGVIATTFHFISGRGFLNPMEFFYITSNSISILGVILVFLGRHLINSIPKIHVLAFLLMGFWLIFSGQGRSAFIILLTGISFNIKWTTRKTSCFIVFATMISLLFIYQDLFQSWIFNNLSGREIVWEQAINVFKAFPIGGTGSYQYASIANPFDNPCAISTDFDILISQNQCPDLIQHLHKPWLIAHNGALHALAENGVVGLFGWSILWGTAIVGAWYSQSQFIRAVILGLLAANHIDNVTLIPSPGFSELFFILIGVAWSKKNLPHQLETQKHTHHAAMLGLSIGISMLLTALILKNHTSKLLPSITVNHILLPRHYVKNETYAMYLDLSDNGKKYEKNISIEQCTQYNACKSFGNLRWVNQNFSEWIYTKIEQPTKKLRLSLYYTPQMNLRFLIKEWIVLPESSKK